MNKGRSMMTTISERCHIGRQKVFYEHVWCWRFEVNQSSHVLKTTIERDSSNWSGGKVWRFDGTKWQLLLMRFMDEMPGLHGISIYSTPKPGVGDFSGIALRLENEARDILECL